MNTYPLLRSVTPRLTLPGVIPAWTRGFGSCHAALDERTLAQVQGSCKGSTCVGHAIEFGSSAQGRLDRIHVGLDLRRHAVALGAGGA